MLKVEIAFDEDKILTENKYDLDKIFNYLDKSFKSYNLKKISKGIYSDNGNDKDFAHMWNIIWSLASVEWFKDNVSKILWYNSDINNNVRTENVLQYFKDNNIGLFNKSNIEVAV